MSWTPKNTKEIKDTKRYKRMKKHNYFTKNYTPSNKKKKEEMEKAVKLIHKFMVYDIIKKFMNYDFMADMPSENE